MWKSENFKDGKLHGKSIIYHENGKVKKEQNYKEGQLDGKAFQFLEDGTKVEETDWVNGRTIFGRSFRRDGDTLSVRRGDKVVTYYTTKKIAGIFCVSGNDKIEGTLKFSEDGQVLKREGSLICLTHQDTLVLKAQYPEWLKD